MMTVARRGRTKKPPSSFIFYISPALLSEQSQLSHPQPLSPTFHSQHAYNCCSLKFNSAPCPASSTTLCSTRKPPLPSISSPTHTPSTTTVLILHYSASSLIFLRPLWMPPKAHRSGQEQTLDQIPREEMGWKRPFLWSAWKKSMASFMNACLSSAHCEGGPDNPPVSTFKKEKLRDRTKNRGQTERKRIENDQGSLATLGQHLHVGLRIRSSVISSDLGFRLVKAGAWGCCSLCRLHRWRQSLTNPVLSEKSRIFPRWVGNP